LAHDAPQRIGGNDNDRGASYAPQYSRPTLKVRNTMSYQMLWDILASGVHMKSLEADLNAHADEITVQLKRNMA
jgi:hypothetical protein